MYVTQTGCCYGENKLVTWFTAVLKNQRCGKVDNNRKDCAELGVPENVVGCVSCGYMWPTILQLLSNRHFFFFCQKGGYEKKGWKLPFVDALKFPQDGTTCVYWQCRINLGSTGLQNLRLTSPASLRVVPYEAEFSPEACFPCIFIYKSKIGQDYCKGTYTYMCSVYAYHRHT